MDFGFWYDVAVYGNANWKGDFTAKEIATNAYDYLWDWEYTLKESEVAPGLDTLMHQLHEDYCNGSKEAINLLETIVDELKYNDIEWFID